MCITKTNSSEKPGGAGEQADNLGKDSWRNRSNGTNTTTWHRHNKPP